MINTGTFGNSVRNAILALLAGIGCLLLSLQIGGIAFVLSEGGVAAIDIDFLTTTKPIDMLEDYFNWWLQNIYIIGFKYHNFFILRLLGSIFLPPIILMGLAYLYRENIYKIRPFQEGESLHGDARWATPDDVTAMGLRKENGMIIGEDAKGLLVADGYQHALLFAPTGSGKGVGFAIPNLLYWQDSLIVHDIKLENYLLTSGWRRSQGQEVYVWSPADPDGITHCYNPLDWISTKPGQMVDDVQKIGNLILPKQEFWTNEARSLFVGVVLYIIADDSKVTSFGEVVRVLRSDDVAYNLAVALDTMGESIHPVGYMNLAAFLQKADKERSGVVSTLNSSLELWANPLIDTATASSDFNIMDFKKKKTTVYVGLTPDNLKRLQPLMQVFYQQATEFLSRKMPGADEPYGVMFMMDEFPTLGQMDQFMNGIAYFRGYKVRLFLIVQDTEQLKGIYKDSGMNSFLSNSTYRITFAANNVQTAELISKMCGNKTVDSVSASKPKFLDFNPASRSVNISKTQRALLLPQEVIGLPRDEQIILIESQHPIRCKKIKYFEHSFFKRRLVDPIAVPQQQPYDPRKAKAAQLAAAPTEELTEEVSEETSVAATVENTTEAYEATESNEQVLADDENAIDTSQEATEVIEETIESEELIEDSPLPTDSQEQQYSEARQPMPVAEAPQPVQQYVQPQEQQYSEAPQPIPVAEAPQPVQQYAQPQEQQYSEAPQPIPVAESPQSMLADIPAEQIVETPVVQNGIKPAEENNSNSGK
jgi:type IV secretion system protein VirD4